MRNFKEITNVQEMNLLVGFFDLSNFARYVGRPPIEMLTMLNDYYELVGDIIEEAGGTIVKFMGDAALIIFDENLVNEGVIALKKLQTVGDKWLVERDIASRNIVTAHFGPVACGPVGTKDEKQFDVFGDTVNIAASLKSHGMAISPQAFRKLNSDTRKLFKKHTPPITYISVDERHRN